MSSVDNRVVEMRFDNEEFQSGVSDSISAIEKLKSALTFNNVDKGFSAVEKAINGISFSGISDSLETISSRFTTFGIIGTQILSDLASSALELGKNLLTAIPEQIISGGKTRALNIEDAKFQLEGLGVAWEDVYNNIDAAVSGTAYGLDEAAKVCSQLVASGVAYGDAESDMAHALRGISGVSAMTNSSYEDIGSIFTTIASNGKLMTQQIRQFSYRGLNVSAVLAEKLGVTEEEISDLVSKGQIDFITFATAMDDAFGEHATRANETFSGALSNMKASLSRIGADFATPILNGSRDIFNALRTTFNTARTYTRSFAENDFTDLFGEAVDYVIEKIEDLDLSDLEHFVNATDNNMKALLNLVKGLDPISDKISKAWKTIFPTTLGEIVESASEKVLDFSEKFKTAYTALVDSSESGNITRRLLANDKDYQNALGNLNQIESAFTGLFNILSTGKNTVIDIIALGKPALAYIEPILDGVLDFFGTFQEGEENLENVKSMASGVFSVFDLCAQAVTSVFNAIKPLFDKLDPFASKILSLGGAIGEWLVSLDEVAIESSFFDNIVNGIVDFLVGVWRVGAETVSDIKNLFTKIYSAVAPTIDELRDKISNFINTIKESSGITVNFSGLQTFFTWLLSLVDFEKVADVLVKVFDIAGTIVGGLVDALSKAVGSGGNLDLSNLFSALANIGLAELGVMLTSGLVSLTNITTAINGAITGLVAGVQADVLLSVAEAVGILAGSIFVLTFVDTDKMWSATAAITTLLGVMLYAMKSLSSKASKGTNFDLDNIFGSITSIFTGKIASRITQGGLAASLIKIAAAVGILAIAVASLAKTENLGAGLGAVTLLLGELLGTMYVVQKLNQFDVTGNSTKGVLKIALGLLLIVESVKSLAGTENMWQGIGGITVLLMELLAAMYVMQQINQLSGLNLGGASSGIVKLAVALLILVPVANTFASMSWEELAKGLTGIAGLLVSIFGFMALMKVTNANKMLGVGVALIGVATAILLMVPAMKTFASMSWEELAKGATAFLAILASVFAFFALMNVAGGSAVSAVALSASLLTISVSMIAFAAAFKVFSGMSWGDLAKGIATLASVFVVLGVAGYLLTPVIGTIVALSASFLLIGVGAAALGVGLALVAVTLTAFSGSVAVLAAALVTALKIILVGITSLDVEIADAISTVIVAIVNALAVSVPSIVTGIMTIIEAVLEAIDSSLPSILYHFGNILLAILVWFGEYIPTFVPILVNDILILFNSLIIALLNALPEMRTGLQQLLTAIGATVMELLVGTFGWLIQGIDLLFGTDIYDKITSFLETGEQAAVDILEQSNSALQEENEALRSTITSESEATADAVEDANSRIDSAMQHDSDGTSSGGSNYSDYLASYYADATSAAEDGTSSASTAISSGTDSILAALSGSSETVTIAGAELGGDALQAVQDAVLNGDMSIEDIMAYISEGGVDGLLSHIDELSSAGNEVGETTVDSIAEGAGVASPSTKTQTTGRYIDEGLALGIQNNVSVVRSPVKTLVNTALSGLSSLKSSAYDYGMYFDQGLASGISAYAYLINAKVKTMAQSALNTLATTIQAHSPAEATKEYGMYFDQGFGAGIDGNTGFVDSAVENMGTSALDGIKAVVGRITDAFDGDFDTSPVIRPVLDLSEIQNGESYIGSMFSGYSLTPDLSYAKSVMTGVGSYTSAESDGQLASSFREMKNSFTESMNRQSEIMSEVKELLSQQKIVLDDGTVVGVVSRGMATSAQRKRGR